MTTGLYRAPAALLTLALTGCDFSGIGGLGEVTSAIGPTLSSISVSGDSVVAVGDTVRLSAVGGLSGGIAFLYGGDRLLDATWTSSDRTIADFARCRSLVSVEADRPFRSKPITRFG